MPLALERPWAAEDTSHHFSGPCMLVYKKPVTPPQPLQAAEEFVGSIQALL